MDSDLNNATERTLDGDNSSVKNMTLREMNDEEIQRLIPTIAYLAVLSVVGIIGNSLVCHVYRTRYRLSNSQCFILCLSAIDLFSCCIVIPLEIATIVDQYTFEYLWLCKLSRFFNTLGTLSSSFLLLFIAVDRYRKVCRPFGWQIKANVAKFLCVLSVLLGLVFSWPAIFIYGKQRFLIPEFGLTGTECSTDDEMLDTIFPLINSAIFGGLFIVGIISICILYCFIGREIHRHAKRMPKELSVRNTSIPMLSSTIDGRDSRISGELDLNMYANYGKVQAKRESKKKSFSKRKSRKADSESSWTDRKDYELSCSMDCSAKDTSAVLNEKDRDEDEMQSDDSGIKSYQTNKDENVDIGPKSNGSDTERDGNDADNNGDEFNDTDMSGVENIVNLEIQNKLNPLEPVNEVENAVDQNYIDDCEEKEIRNSKESDVETSRKVSELSISSESVKPKSIRTRLSSIGSLLSNAVIRRMTSLVSTNSTGAASVVKTQYLKQARARKTAFLMFLITLAFVLSYMPHLLLMIIRQLINNFVENMSDEGRAVYKFFLRSYFLNCAINPVIYGVCDSRFRSACREIFSHCCRRSQSREFN